MYHAIWIMICCAISFATCRVRVSCRKEMWIQSTVTFLCSKLCEDFGELCSIAEWARKGMRVHKNADNSLLAFVFSMYIDFCFYRKATRIRWTRLCRVVWGEALKNWHSYCRLWIWWLSHKRPKIHVHAYNFMQMDNLLKRVKSTLLLLTIDSVNS